MVVAWRGAEEERRGGEIDREEMWAKASMRDRRRNGGGCGSKVKRRELIGVLGQLRCINETEVLSFSHVIVATISKFGRMWRLPSTI